MAIERHTLTAESPFRSVFRIDWRSWSSEGEAHSEDKTCTSEALRDWDRYLRVTMTHCLVRVSEARSSAGETQLGHVFKAFNPCFQGSRDPSSGSVMSKKKRNRFLKICPYLSGDPPL